VKGYPVLLCLNVQGNVQVLSIPSLRQLLVGPLVKLVGAMEVGDEEDSSLLLKLDFSENGLGMFMVSQSEVQKFTTDSEMASQMAECSGELFVPCDMPELPKAGFLRGLVGTSLFSGGSSAQRDAVDLDVIFSEKPSTSAVSSMKSVARQIPANSINNPLCHQNTINNMDNVNSKSITAGQAAQMAMQNLGERGERLNAVVDATENLRNNAMNLQSRSSKLVEKYEKKKWYQL